MTSVHVLGVGSMGGLVAHELALAQAGLDLSVIFRTHKRLLDYQSQNSQLTVMRLNLSSHQTTIPGTTVPQITAKAGKIDNLIVSTKAGQTETALTPLVTKLTPESNVLFLHNGMGVVDQVAARFWPQDSQRPNLFKAISTHGAYKSSPNVINHVGLGNLTISALSSSTPTSALTDAILKTSCLNPKLVDYSEFSLMEIEKLAVNACINPMTALLDCLNGDLLKGSFVRDIFKKILTELVIVVKKTSLSTVWRQEMISRVSVSHLMDLVLEVCHSTSANSSSMREDVRNINPTEIDYINGYICHLGNVYNVRTPANDMMMKMIKSKLSIERTLEKEATNVIV